MFKRIDANQNEIVNAGRKLGATVFITSSLGKGFPDIVLGYKGINYLIEIKDGKKVKSQQKLTIYESKFKKLWKGSVCIITSTNDLLELLKQK